MDLDQDDIQDVVVRLKRAHGHLGKVVQMIETGADCETVLTQLAAVDKAMSRAAFAIVSRGLQRCLADGEVDGVDVQRMEKLFLSLA